MLPILRHLRQTLSHLSQILEFFCICAGLTISLPGVPIFDALGPQRRAMRYANDRVDWNEIILQLQ